MSEIDRTPQASVVDVPQALDSDSGKPVIVPVEAEKGRSVHRSRRGFGRTLVFGGVLAVATLGSDVGDVVTNYQKGQVRADIAEAERVDIPNSLLSAQLSASSKLFKPNGNTTSFGVAHKIIHSRGQANILKVEGYVPEQVEVSEDGRTFKAEGQDYDLRRMISEDGSIYVMASRSVVEEKLLSKDINHAANPVLVGGAHNDASSDINNDGVVTEEEVRDTADENARYNLWKAFAPTKKLLINGNKITEVSQK